MADDRSRSGVTYLDSAILDWVARTHVAHDTWLDQAFDAPRRAGLPAIQVGPSEGALLALLLRMIGARRVVEIGTLAGYSTLHLARALPEDGRLWTIESNPKHASVARETLAGAGLGDRVTVLEGQALEVLPSLQTQAPFCAVFIDADKSNYPHYGRFAASTVRPGGLLLGDNAFLFGRLLHDEAEARAMRAFHEEAKVAFDTVCVPTPDGLLVGLRRGISVPPAARRTGG